MSDPTITDPATPEEAEQPAPAPEPAPSALARKGEPKAPVLAGPTGLVLTDLDQMYRFARAAALSGLAPKGMNSPEKCLVAMQFGAELRLGPMASLRSIYITPSGRPALYVESALAVVMRSGWLTPEFYHEFSGEGQTRTCTWHYHRRGWKEWRERSFCFAEAVTAGLVKADSNWVKWPDRMILARVRGFALKDDFADVLQGVAMETDDDEATASVPAPPTPTARKPPAVDPLLADDEDESESLVLVPEVVEHPHAAAFYAGPEGPAVAPPAWVRPTVEPPPPAPQETPEEQDRRMHREADAALAREEEMANDRIQREAEAMRARRKR